MGQHPRHPNAFGAHEAGRSPSASSSTNSSRRDVSHESLCANAPPLSSDDIALNTLAFHISPEQVTSHRACPICMQDFVVGEACVTLRCFHVFHCACSDRWLQQSGNCPVCRVAAA